MRSGRGTKCLLSVSPWSSASWEVWQRHQREERIWVREGLWMENRAERIWQQVLTVRGPWEDCYWQLSRCEVRPLELSSCLHVKTECTRANKRDVHVEQRAPVVCAIEHGCRVTGCLEVKEAAGVCQVLERHSLKIIWANYERARKHVCASKKENREKVMRRADEFPLRGN